jgi:hypothetical protein
MSSRKAVQQQDVPASTLTGNGMVFTTRLAGDKVDGPKKLPEP